MEDVRRQQSEIGSLRHVGTTFLASAIQLTAHPEACHSEILWRISCGGEAQFLHGATHLEQGSSSMSPPECQPEQGRGQRQRLHRRTNLC